jgi:hypothetical protein
METNNLNNETAPVVEKVSLKTVKQEKAQASIEENEILSKLVSSALAMTDEERLKAIAFLDKKLQILKKLK